VCVSITCGFVGLERTVVCFVRAVSPADQTEQTDRFVPPASVGLMDVVFRHRAGKGTSAQVEGFQRTV